MSERKAVDLSALRTLFLIAAVILFVLSALGVGHNLLPWGLAVLACALLF